MDSTLGSNKPSSDIYTKYTQADATRITNALSQYKQYKQEYRDLQNLLGTISEELEYDAMVPVGPLAFFPGKLVHTNEVLVLLGDNWFAERSAKQAQGIAKRRELFLNQKIMEAKKSLEQINARHNILGNNSISEKLEDAQFNEDGERIIDIKEDLEDEQVAAFNKSNGPDPNYISPKTLKDIRERAIRDDVLATSKSGLGSEEKKLLDLVNQFGSEDEEEEEGEDEEYDSDHEDKEIDGHDEEDMFYEDDRVAAMRDDDEDDFNDSNDGMSSDDDNRNDDDNDDEVLDLKIVEHNTSGNKSKQRGILKSPGISSNNPKSVRFDTPDTEYERLEVDTDSSLTTSSSDVSDLMSLLNMSKPAAVNPPRIEILDTPIKQQNQRSPASSLKFPPKVNPSRSSQRPIKSKIVEREDSSLDAEAVTNDTVDEDIHAKEIAQAYNRKRFARLSAGRFDDAPEIAERVLESLSCTKLINPKTVKGKDADDGYERIELPSDPDPYANNPNPKPPMVIHAPRKQPQSNVVQESSDQSNYPQPEQKKMSRFKARRMGLEN